jgi:hypothetical protein
MTPSARPSRRPRVIPLRVVTARRPGRHWWALHSPRCARPGEFRSTWSSELRSTRRLMPLGIRPRRWHRSLEPPLGAARRSGWAGPCLASVRPRRAKLTFASALIVKLGRQTVQASQHFIEFLLEAFESVRSRPGGRVRPGTSTRRWSRFIRLSIAIPRWARRHRTILRSARPTPSIGGRAARRRIGAHRIVGRSLVLMQGWGAAVPILLGHGTACGEDQHASGQGSYGHHTP